MRHAAAPSRHPSTPSTVASRVLRGAAMLTAATVTTATVSLVGLVAAVPAGAAVPPARAVASSTTSVATVLSLQPGQGALRSSGTSFLDGSVVVTVAVPKLPTSGGLYLAAQLRGTATAAYRPRLKVLPDGTLRLDLKRVINGAEQGLGTEVVIPGKVVPGSTVTLEATVTGTTAPVVRSRAWLTGTGKPTWQLSHQDSAAGAVTVPGAAGLWAYLSSSSAALSVSYSNLVGTPLATTAPVPVITSVTPGTVKPDASNTGVPAGTALRVVYGDLEVTTPGTVLDGIDLRGFLRVKARDVTVTRSIIRGGPAVRVEGVVTVAPTATNFVISDSEVYPSQPSVMLDGIKGANFTARRVEVWGGVDNIKVHGSNVLVESSYLHDQNYYASDPLQGGGATHNDALQVLGGDNVRAVGNTLVSRKELNAAVQVTQDFAPVTRMVLARNWIDGGGCSVNVNHKKLTELRGISVTDNIFGRNTRYSSCAVILTTRAYPTLSGNRYTDGVAVVPKYMAP